MDAADLIRQAQSSVEKARQRSSSRHNTHEEDNQVPDNTYTLTACCRCRQACNLCRSIKVRELTQYRERQNVIPASHGVCLASVLALSVNTMIELKTKGCVEAMCSIYKKKLEY